MSLPSFPRLVSASKAAILVAFPLELDVLPPFGFREVTDHLKPSLLKSQTASAATAAGDSELPTELA